MYTYPGVSYPVPARDIFHAKLQALLADAEEYGATLALRTQLRGGQVYQEGWGGHKKFLAMGDGQIMVIPEVWMKLTSESIHLWGWISWCQLVSKSTVTADGAGRCDGGAWICGFRWCLYGRGHWWQVFVVLWFRENPLPRCWQMLTTLRL